MVSSRNGTIRELVLLKIQFDFTLNAEHILLTRSGLDIFLIKNELIARVIISRFQPAQAHRTFTVLSLGHRYWDTRLTRIYNRLHILILTKHIGYIFDQRLGAGLTTWLALRGPCFGRRVKDGVKLPWVWHYLSSLTPGYYWELSQRQCPNTTVLIRPRNWTQSYTLALRHRGSQIEY